MATRSNKEHKQCPIYSDGEVIFSVDEKLQGLMQFFVDNEILTHNSCQHNVRGTCWIEFYLFDWLDLTEVSFKTEAQELYRFIQEECEVRLLSLDDGCMDENDEFWLEGENLIWSASVRFKKELLPTFEAIMRTTVPLKSSAVVAS